MIETAPYEPLGAMAVLSCLDPNDRIEVASVRGRSTTHLDIFADWHTMQAHAIVSMIIKDAATKQPFAVLAMGNTGQAGVAQAALLARNHAKWRRGLAKIGREIRQQMPLACAELGIHRIEARAWADHPTAGRFLTSCGFDKEAIMPGFGPDGMTTFTQFAWTAQPKGD